MKRPEMQKDAKILLVDDDQQLLQSMGSWLTELGFQTFLAHNFESAGKILSNETIHVALVDVRLGPEDGFEILKTLSTTLSQYAGPINDWICHNQHGYRSDPRRRL